MGNIKKSDRVKAPSAKTSINKKVDTTLINKDCENNEIKTRKYKCTCCGQSWDNPTKHFNKSKSPLYEGNNGYVNVCYDCRDKYYYSILSLYSGEEEKAIDRMCQIFDWFFHDEPFTASKQISDDRSRVGDYASKLNLNQTVRKGSTYVDTIKWRSDNVKTIDSIEDIQDISDYSITTKMIKFWGLGYEPTIYQTLQGYYDELLKLCENKPDIKKQKMMKNLCLLEYQMQSNIQAGKDIGTLSNSYKSLFEAAELKVDTADTSNDSFGKWLMDIEKYSPAEYYQDKKKYHDFFGIIEYIERFMFRPLKNLIFGTQEKEKEYWINEEDSETKDGD